MKDGVYPYFYMCSCESTTEKELTPKNLDEKHISTSEYKHLSIFEIFLSPWA